MAPPFSSPFSIPMLMLLFITVVYQAHAQLPRQTTSVFYLQDQTTGSNATVAAVAGLRGRDWNYNSFGTIFVVDDPITLSPSPGSAVVGRAQGILAVSSHDAANVNVVLSLVFSNSQYGGSTLEVQGISRQRENYKELSVVSGTGQFRFVKGYATLQTVSYDPRTTLSVVRLTVTIQTS